MKKAQMNGMGIIILTAITLIVGLILFQTIAQEVGKSTSTVTVVNETISTSISNVSSFYIDYRSISGVTILNGTAGGQGSIATGNYTITNNAIDPSDGTLSVKITPATTVDWSAYGTTWRISGTAQPVTYIADSGARSVAGIIAIFFALAIVVVALMPSLRSELFSMIGR